MSKVENVIIEGVDPGRDGALAFIDPYEGTLVIYDLPTKSITGTSRIITKADPVIMAGIVRLIKPLAAYIEDVSSSPQMGVASAFSFGRNAGCIEGVHGGLMVPLNYVRPNVWKSNMKVPADKKQAVARARELMPECSDLFTRADKAEAALIALYGCMASGHPPKKRITPL